MTIFDGLQTMDRKSRLLTSEGCGISDAYQTTQGFRFAVYEDDANT